MTVFGAVLFKPVTSCFIKDCLCTAPRPCYLHVGFSCCPFKTFCILLRVFLTAVCFQLQLQNETGTGEGGGGVQRTVEVTLNFVYHVQTGDVTKFVSSEIHLLLNI